MASQSAPHILIVEARFYDDMSDALLVGATAALEAAGATWETITVPGCLEIPPAVAMALDATEDGGTATDSNDFTIAVIGYNTRGQVMLETTYDIQYCGCTDPQKGWCHLFTPRPLNKCTTKNICPAGKGHISCAAPGYLFRRRSCRH